MTPAFARPLLHGVHLLTFVVLLGTGLLLFIPALRAIVTGGYSLVLRSGHRWGGVAFVAFPAIIVLRGGGRRMFTPSAQPSARAVWQNLHLAVTVAMSAMFVLTGAVLWGKRTLPDLLVQTSLVTHDWLTYAALILLAAHVVEVGSAALRARLKSAATVTAPAGDAT